METLATILREFGRPANLISERVRLNDPEPDEALVKVLACGVNFHDIDVRRGASGRGIALPLILGREIAGVVEQAAPDGSGPPVGTYVAVMYYIPCGTCDNCMAEAEHMCSHMEYFGVTRDGGYADHVIAPTRALIALPNDVDPAMMAAGQITYSTAIHSLFDRGDLQQGETVLITGATGGVGSACIQVANSVGAHPIAAIGTASKADVAMELGAEEVVLLPDGTTVGTSIDPGPVNRAKSNAVDLVIDTAGGPYLTAALERLRPGGRVVVVGGHAGEVVPVDLVKLFRLEHSLIGTARARRREIEQALNSIATGEYVPLITRRVGLPEVASIHVAMEERSLIGKAIIEPI